MKKFGMKFTPESSRIIFNHGFFTELHGYIIPAGK